MPPSGQLPRPLEKPLVVFDGDCGFCRFWIERCRRLTGDTFQYEPFQTEAAKLPEIPRRQFEEAVQLIDADGAIYSGADAALRLLEAAPCARPLARLAEKTPGALPLARIGYRIVAKNRTAFSWLTRVVWGRDPRPSTYGVARRLFAHGLGLIFLCAFLSLFVQLPGLIGAHGISPAADFLQTAHDQLGSEAYTVVPTVFWWASSDLALNATCLVGIALSAIMALGICPGLCALLCWTLYLSFCSVGGPFFGFQWDALLLEAALPAAICLPWRIHPRWAEVSRLSTLGRWLLWWLLFRLTLESGVVKLSSGDPTWHDLTAMTYHYETQPLPLWTAWYAHQAPLWFHKLEVRLVFAVELVAPFAIILPRRLRHAGAWAMIGLQIGIMATGNFAFFNWLTILLCLLLFDDLFWPERFRQRLLVGSVYDILSPARWRKHLPTRTSLPITIGRRWPAWLFAPPAILAVLLTGVGLVNSWAPPSTNLIETPRSLDRCIAPLRSSNSYGLFRVMTTERPEIIVEGSNDGYVWRAYGFRWKPGDLYDRPKLVAPHQPRLDWQMWFAALGSYRQNPWFIHFLQRLLEGSPEVLALLESNPFPDHPPRFIRGVVYRYHFTAFGDGSAWWKREQEGLYCPPLSLRENSAK